MQSICSQNWDQSLAKIGYDLNAQISQIALEGKPVADSISVYVDDVKVMGWSYLPDVNAVKFLAGSVPVTGSKIRVDYSVVAP